MLTNHLAHKESVLDAPTPGGEVILWSPFSLQYRVRPHHSLQCRNPQGSLECFLQCPMETVRHILRLEKKGDGHWLHQERRNSAENNCLVFQLVPRDQRGWVWQGLITD